MAGSKTRRNLAPVGENKLFERAPIKSSNISIPSLAQTPIPDHAPTSTPTPGPPSMYTNVNLLKATRLALELFIKS